MMQRIRLSSNEVKYIRENYNKLSTREIAEWIGCSTGTVLYHLKKENFKIKNYSQWSPIRKEELIKLRFQGASLEELAKHFNVSLFSVKGIIRKMRDKGVKIPTEWDIRLIKKGLLKY